jgi:hypothetical protein
MSFVRRQHWVRTRNQRGARLITVAVVLPLMVWWTPARGVAAVKGDAIGNVVIAWNNVALTSIRNLQLCRPDYRNLETCVPPYPTVVARALAIVHTCMFDAWAAYDDKAVATVLGGSLRRPPIERTIANKEEAISFAAFHCLSDVFPHDQFRYRALLLTLGYTPTATTTRATTPDGIGFLAARSVLDGRHHDGSNQLGDLHPGPYTDYTDYQPVNDPDHINDPDRWQRLRVPDGQGGILEPSVTNFWTPFWQRVTPFALSSGSQFRPPAPPYYASDPAGYTSDVQEIIEVSARLTDEHKTIAEYWSDGPASETPPGHWNLLAAYVSSRDAHTLDEDVKLFFALNNALFDAGIACWDAKRAYDYVRPITAIRFLNAGRPVEAWAGPGLGTRVIDGGAWTPYQRSFVVTPPFPEYVSGHSTFSAAAAQVLRRATGSDYFGASARIFAGASNIEPGITPRRDIVLSWQTFSQAADEAGMSRRYGGIHFAHGDLQGRQMGRKIGDQAFERAQTFIGGR